MRPSPALVIAFVALVASLSGVAMATIPARDGDVHVCYSKKTGDVKLVDTQKDDFDCERNWRGFKIDTEPPAQLVSPNGKFTVEATDSGARLVGPSSTVAIDLSGAVTINGTSLVDIKSSGVVRIRGSQIQNNKQR